MAEKERKMCVCVSVVCYLHFAQIKTMCPSSSGSAAVEEGLRGDWKTPWDDRIISKEGQMVVWLRGRAEEVSGSENARGRACR